MTSIRLTHLQSLIKALLYFQTGGSTSVDRKNIRTDWEEEKPKVYNYSTPLSTINLCLRMQFGSVFQF